MNGFDFGFSPEGEIILDNNTHDILKADNDTLRLQLTLSRLESVSRNWFIDEIGADLEEIIGKPCTTEVADYGKTKIIESLTFDDLWDPDNIVIKTTIQNNTTILYTIFLKMYQSETEDIYSYEIEAELDLVRGVFVRYGW